MASPLPSSLHGNAIKKIIFCGFPKKFIQLKLIIRLPFNIAFRICFETPFLRVWSGAPNLAK